MQRTIKKFILMASMLTILMQFPMTSYAKENENSMRGYDIRTKECSESINFSQKLVSINPTMVADVAPDFVKTVDFSVTLVGYLHYDAITGKYVSASSPTATINYQGPVALSMESFSTSYHDNGDSVTFSFSGKLVGRVTLSSGLYCTMDYGNVSGSYTAKKY